MTSEFDLTDRRLLNELQTAVPLVEKPFHHIGETLGIPASEVMERTATLKRKHVIRQISAIFDTRRLGYKTVLVAMRFAPERLDDGAHVMAHLRKHYGSGAVSHIVLTHPDGDHAGGLRTVLEECDVADGGGLWMLRPWLYGLCR